MGDIFYNRERFPESGGSVDPFREREKEMIRINEMFCSLQGESTFAGLPCYFIRLAGCNLRCSYCDTAYAFAEGREVSIAEILWEVDAAARPWRGAILSGHLLPLVEVTGGEPLVDGGSLLWHPIFLCLLYSFYIVSC